MAMFSFADIRFGTATIPGFGANQDLLGGKYGYEIYRYPIDIGSVDKGHYMVIHINEQRRTQVGSRAINNGDLPTIYENRSKNKTPTLGSSITNPAGFLNDLTGGAISDLVNKLPTQLIPNFSATDLSVGFARTIRRTRDTIAIYMPDTLAFSQAQSYSEPSITGLTAGLITGGSSAVDSIKKGGDVKDVGVDIIKNLSPFAGAALANRAGGIFQVGFAAITGLVQNPMIEMIYSSPVFRSFRFEFMLYPRSEIEAKEVQKIIETLKYHQAPEIQKDSNGFFLVPPSEFDIKFFYNGKENPNIPKISTCILNSIDMDYAPNGWAAYESVGEPKPSLGGTGMPVGIRLGLNFKETEYLTKDNYKEQGVFNNLSDLISSLKK